MWPSLAGDKPNFPAHGPLNGLDFEFLGAFPAKHDHFVVFVPGEIRGETPVPCLGRSDLQHGFFGNDVERDGKAHVLQLLQVGQGGLNLDPGISEERRIGKMPHGIYQFLGVVLDEQHQGRALDASPEAESSIFEGHDLASGSQPQFGQDPSSMSGSPG
jgi:hypothetical protein